MLVVVQSSLNSRPLWPSDDGDLDQPITCNDILHPKGLIHENDALNISNPRTRYGFIQKLVDEWWQYWMLHFVPNLQVQSKWYMTCANLSTDDVVLCIDSSIKQ